MNSPYDKGKKQLQEEAQRRVDEMVEDFTLRSSLSPSAKAHRTRLSKILEGKGQEVIDELESI